MSKIKYTDEPMGKIKIVDDFLPDPKELVLKKRVVKITLSVSKDSLDYFKREAERYDENYQTIMRALLEKYSQHYSRKSKSKSFC